MDKILDLIKKLVLGLLIGIGVFFLGRGIYNWFQQKSAETNQTSPTPPPSSPSKIDRVAELAKDWNKIHIEFVDKHVKEWLDNDFTYEKCKEWIDIGLKPWDAAFVHWIKNVKKEQGTEPESILNNEEIDLDEWREEFNNYLKEKQAEKFKGLELDLMKLTSVKQINFFLENLKKGEQSFASEAIRGEILKKTEILVLDNGNEKKILEFIKNNHDKEMLFILFYIFSMNEETPTSWNLIVYEPQLNNIYTFPTTEHTAKGLLEKLTNDKSLYVPQRNVYNEIDRSAEKKLRINPYTLDLSKTIKGEKESLNKAIECLAAIKSIWSYYELNEDNINEKALGEVLNGCDSYDLEEFVESYNNYHSGETF